MMVWTFTLKSYGLCLYSDKFLDDFVTRFHTQSKLVVCQAQKNVIKFQGVVFSMLELE